MKKQVFAVTRGCTFCGGCIHECPVRAITIGPEGASIDPEKCTGCGRCADNCASEAITKVEVSIS